jgi:hypothetical protein
VVTVSSGQLCIPYNHDWRRILVLFDDEITLWLIIGYLQKFITETDQHTKYNFWEKQSSFELTQYSADMIIMNFLSVNMIVLITLKKELQ